MELPISICATSPSSDEKAEMKFRFTLQRRLFLWFTLLFVVLTGAILFVIEKKEVATIYEESTNKAVLIARHTADRNLQSILTWDMDRLQRDADRRRADAPLYVVFYDRYATPLVTSSLIAGRSDRLPTKRTGFSRRRAISTRRSFRRSSCICRPAGKSTGRPLSGS